MCFKNLHTSSTEVNIFGWNLRIEQNVEEYRATNGTVTTFEEFSAH